MKIDGKIFSQMCVSGANALDNNQATINALNVFPVPDGDTGINMSLTMSSVQDLDDFNGTISDCAMRISNNILRSARGNSGAILSLFFRGFAKSLKGLESADAEDFAKAFEYGTREAYSAVMNPTEGTILTVMRHCAEEAERAVAENKFAKDDVRGLFAYIVNVGEEALAHTPDQLPILKEVNVVDAGGAGFMTALNGMLSALNGAPVAREDAGETAKEADFSEFNTEDITFPYCTECIVEKYEQFQGEGHAEEFHKLVGSIGDSVVFVEDESIIKVHVHTDHPGAVMEKACEFGMLVTVKIENMRKQHSAIVSDKQDKKKAEPVIAAPEKKFGFVSVCMGEGIRETFIDLGVDTIIFGGQTMNPSTQDIIDGVNKTPAEVVYVLPNNKNIYMVAAQAAKLVKDKQVIVMETRSVPQGLSAVLAFNPEGEVEENTEAMKEAVTHVVSMSVTHAVRDTTIDGKRIENDQMMGLVDGKIEYVANTPEECLKMLTEKMDGATYITLFCGEEVSDEGMAEAEQIIRSSTNGAEVVAIKGGQPIYNYVISVEK